MRHLRKFNENALGRELHAKKMKDPTEELMKVLKPYFDENGLEGTKEYLTNILDNFDYDDFIEYHYGKK